MMCRKTRFLLSSERLGNDARKPLLLVGIVNIY